MLRRVHLGPLLLTLALGATPRAALAQDDATRAAARTLAHEGHDADRRGDPALAEAKFDKAYALVPVPVLGVSSARARVKLGKLVEAAERYRQVLRFDPAAVPIAGAGLNLPLQQQALADAERELEALLPRVPRIVLQLVGAEPHEVQLTLDGASVPSAVVGEPYPINPGAHRLRAWRGIASIERDLSIAEGASEPVVLAFSTPLLPVVSSPATPAVKAAPTAPPAASASRSPPAFDVGRAAEPGRARAAPAPAPRLEQILGWSLVSLGGALLAVGGVSYLYWADQKQEIEGRNGGDLACDAPARGPCDRYNAWRRVPLITSVAGGVLAVAGGAVLAWPWANAVLELRLALVPEGDSLAQGLALSPKLILGVRSLEAAAPSF